MFVYTVHALAFLSIFINIRRGTEAGARTVSVLWLYLAHVIYFTAMMVVIPRFVSLSRGLQNITCMLIAVGLIIQTRLSFNIGVRHFIFIVAGTIIFLAGQFSCKKITWLHKLTWVYCGVGAALLIAVLIFAQLSYGAKISIDLGFFSFQPFELVKILFVLFVAAAFNKENNFKTVLFTALAGGAYIIILVFCSDLGTALLLAVVYVMMLYVATKKLRYIIIGAVVFVFACILAYMLFSHVRVRVDVWLNPWADIDNRGYQITQSLFALGTGGWLGLGLYNGRPASIPKVANDFVFSAISEEMGAIFAIFLIMLCLSFVLMAFKVAIRVSKPFYKLVAFGLGASYGFQVFLTVGGAIKMIPSTGINLPFISSGGTSIIASMIVVGVIQAIYVISEDDAVQDKSITSDRVILKYQNDAIGEDDGKI